MMIINFIIQQIVPESRLLAVVRVISYELLMSVPPGDKCSRDLVRALPGSRFAIRLFRTSWPVHNAVGASQVHLPCPQCVTVSPAWFGLDGDLCYNLAHGGRDGGVVNWSEWRWVTRVTLALVIVSSLPYLVAWGVTPEGAHFTGLVLNPQDGNSYIAKMRQGLAGSWMFRLPYTPEQHDGAPVYLFYLFWGHVARWTGLPIIVAYHGVRIVGGALMLLAFYALISRLSDDVGERRIMFALTALGSGLGWLVGLFGPVTADLWVPEAFPVYALLANAHFPLAMALMAGAACGGLSVVERGGGRWGLGMVLAAVALGVVQPFGLLAVFGGLGAMLVGRVLRERAVPWRATAWLIGAGVAATPYPVYMHWALRSTPVLAEWTAQNVTPSPPPWDWALSYGLVLALAVPGLIFTVRRCSGGDWLLLGWVVVTLTGLYAPVSLQRRLSLGLGVPVGSLAGIGWWRVVRPRLRGRRRKSLQGLVVVFCAMTPIFLALMAILAALAGDPWFYLSDGEWAALKWLRDEGSLDAVVLCAPQTGLFVPAWAGQRVIYGHPFETVDAERRKAQVTEYWIGDMSLAEQASFFRESGVGYVLVGPREVRLATGDHSGRTEFQIAGMGGELAFEAGDVRVYKVSKQQ
jgi:hypothetical protein